MSYIAVHYVKVGRRMYTPGEIIDEDIPETKRERLLAKGAICTAGAPFASSAQELPADPPADPPADTRGKSASDDDGKDEGDDGKDEDEGEEITGDAPEIDVMDGIVSPAQTPAKAKSKTAGRRKKA